MQAASIRIWTWVTVSINHYSTSTCLSLSLSLSLLFFMFLFVLLVILSQSVWIYFCLYECLYMQLSIMRHFCVCMGVYMCLCIHGCVCALFSVCTMFMVFAYKYVCVFTVYTFLCLLSECSSAGCLLYAHVSLYMCDFSILYYLLGTQLCFCVCK